MKKALFTAMMVLILVGTVFSGGQKEGSDATNLKFNFVKSSSDPEFKWYDEYFGEISEKSGGTITYDLYPSEAIGKTPDVLEMAAQGEPVVVDCDLSYLANYVPDFAAGMAPYLIQTPEQIEKFWKSDVGQRLCAQLEEKGLHLIDLHYFGTRNLIANTEVNSRDEIGKLKIRCAPTKGWNEVVRVLGGNATNTAWSEVYQALSQGVADGAESPYALLYSAKLYEPCKYIIKTEHLVASTAIVMSSEVYNNLPQQAKDALDSVGSAYPKKAIELALSVEQVYIDKLLAAGVKILDIDKTEFIKAAEDTPKQFPEWTPGIYEEIKAALAE